MDSLLYLRALARLQLHYAARCRQWRHGELNRHACTDHVLCELQLQLPLSDADWGLAQLFGGAS